jgi:CRP/FNR family transcriptional regulator, cyclic AMP receptor protein
MHHWLTLHLGIDAGWQTNAFGYLASALVLCSFSATTMRTLRGLAIGSNISFIIYATISGLMPILVLHALLLPMNIYRLVQIARLPNAGVT